MTPTVPMREPESEGVAGQRVDAEPMEELALAEAEEEEMAELWASDRGNQGA